MRRKRIGRDLNKTIILTFSVIINIEVVRSNGYMALRENAIMVLLDGVTTFDEIVRVTGLSLWSII